MNPEALLRSMRNHDFFFGPHLLALWNSGGLPVPSWEALG